MRVGVGAADARAWREAEALAASSRGSVGDASGELGQRLLVDGGSVPVVPDSEICLARQIAAIGAPAMATQEIGGRGKHVGARMDQVAAAVAVEIDGILQVFRRQELRLAELAE